MTCEVFPDLEQGSDEWREARCGIVTASCMSDVLAKGQGRARATYLYKLIGERVTGEPAESYTNRHMERGHEQEPIARELYEEQAGVAVEQVGFMRLGEVGYSPDGLIGDCGLIEIKSRLPHLQAEIMDKNDVPRAHRLQVQTGMWVSGRHWCDYVSYSPGFPLFTYRVERDNAQIVEIMEGVDAFYADLDAAMGRIMR